MVHSIWVSKTLQAAPPTIRIINFDQYCNGDSGVELNDALDMFEEYTTNFIDLGYWDSATVLSNGGVPIEKFMRLVGSAIQRLEDDGFPQFDAPDDDDDTQWMNGWEAAQPHNDTWTTPQRLPRATRCSILNYHLRCIYTQLTQFDDDVYVFAHNGEIQNK